MSGVYHCLDFINFINYRQVYNIQTSAVLGATCTHAFLWIVTHLVASGYGGAKYLLPKISMLKTSCIHGRRKIIRFGSGEMMSILSR